MNNHPLVVVVDADAIVAQASSGDDLHASAVKIAKKLTQLNVQVLYPVTAIAEAITHMQRVLNSGVTAYGTAIAFTDPNVRVIEINKDTLKHATQFLRMACQSLALDTLTGIFYSFPSG